MPVSKRVGSEDEVYIHSGEKTAETLRYENGNKNGNVDKVYPHSMLYESFTNKTNTHLRLLCKYGRY